jgi:hypothetical protein
MARVHQIPKLEDAIGSMDPVEVSTTAREWLTWAAR